MGKRILFVAMNLNSGGAERQQVTIATSLKERGYDVSFVCYDEGDFFLDQLESVGIKVFWLLKKGTVERLLSFRRFIRKGNYDVVISFLETPNILNCFAALGGKKWRVITGERSAKPELLLSQRGHVVAWLQKKTDILVCNSYNAAAMWKKNYPFLEKKLATIYNFIRVKPQLVDNNYFPGEQIRIVVAASYQFLKNPINVVKALATLPKNDLGKIKIDWFGNKEAIPSAYGETKKLIEENQLQQVITLYDATKNIHDEMRTADFVGLFSSVEGLPNTICEALKLGKPIIFSRVSDYANLVQNNGFLCDGNDYKDIARVFQLALETTPSSRVEMGEESKKIADYLFEDEAIINKWISLIEA